MIYMFYEDLFTFGTFFEMLKCISVHSLSINKLPIFLMMDANLLKHPDAGFHSLMRNYGTVDF